MKQLRLDNYTVLNIAPKEYHQKVIPQDASLFLYMLKVDYCYNFRLPTFAEYIKIYKKTKYLYRNNGRYLTSSPITRRIHKYGDLGETQGYVDAMYMEYPRISHDVYNTVDFMQYYIIPVQSEYKPNIIGKLCIQLSKLGTMMSMLY